MDKIKHLLFGVYIAMFLCTVMLTIDIVNTQKKIDEAVEKLSKKLDKIDVDIKEQPPVEEALPLAVKNNNPLNIKVLASGEPWQGQVGKDKFNHAVFKEPIYGVRAAARVLLNYNKKHGIDTVEGIVDRYCKGNKDKYKEHLRTSLKLKENEKIDMLERLEELLYAMAVFESGVYWDEALFAPYNVLQLVR